MVRVRKRKRERETALVEVEQFVFFNEPFAINESFEKIYQFVNRKGWRKSFQSGLHFRKEAILEQVFLEFFN